MKILTKLNLFSLAIVVTVAVLIVLSGTLVINDIIYDLNSRIVTVKLENVYSMVEERYDVLKEHNLLGVEDYVKSAQQEVADSLKQYHLGETGHFYVVAKDGTVISHSHPDSFEAVEPSKLSEMLASRQGNIEYVFQGKNRFCMYNTFPGWDWLIAFSITKEEMFSKRAQYLRQVSMIGLVVTILTLIGASIFSRSIAKRVNSTLNCVKSVEAGDLSFRIPKPYSSDEIGILQKGVNSMASTIQTRTQEQHELEKALRKNEEKFKDLFNNTGDAVFIRKMEGRFLEVNQMACDQYGYSREEFLQMSPMDLDFPENSIKLSERTKTILQKGRHIFETIHIKKDKSIIPVEISGRAIDYDGQTSIISIVRDISERKQSEEALMESEAKYRSMMEAMSDPIYICSHDFRVEFMNPSMIKRIGRDATGEHCFKALHDLDEKCPECLHHKTQAGEHYTTNIVSPKDNRSYFVSHSPIFHEDSSISKMTIFRDTTDYKKMEAQLQQAQKMEAIGTLAGGIAHDFNNILFPISGYTEMLLHDIPDDSPFHHSLSEILAGTKRAGELVKQILTFSRQPESTA